MNYVEYKDKEELNAKLNELFDFNEYGAIKSCRNDKTVQEKLVWNLQYNVSAHPKEEMRKEAMNVLKLIAKYYKLESASNYEYFNEKSHGKHMFTTVPAMNCRMLTFNMVRAALRTQKRLKNPHIVFELALSERGYTAQKMDEYVALIRAAHISLGLSNQKFYVQGDHYQTNPDKFKENKEEEVNRIKGLIKEALENDVLNIDIDTSHFETADPNKTPEQNQKMNAELTAQYLFYIRQLEQQMGLPVVSCGGEVGEVGGTNTKYPEVAAYLSLLHKRVEELAKKDGKINFQKIHGLSKVSINVGSAHGGQLGPDGKPLDEVPLDFQAHHDVYMKCKDPFHPNRHVVSVQHGASTLPKHYFALFPAMHVGEVHLATGFQNVTWDVLQKHEPELYKKMEKMVHDKFGAKVKKHKTPAIGFMKERKRVTQFFKKELLLIKPKSLEALEKALEQEMTQIFHSLHVLLLPKDDNAVEGDRSD